MSIRRLALWTAATGLLLGAQGCVLRDNTPVNYGYASGGYAQASVTVEQPSQYYVSSVAPEPLYEQMTASPGYGYVWIDGYWHWNGYEWVWVRGRWMRQPEGLVYVSPYYDYTAGRYMYQPGYWSHPERVPRGWSSYDRGPSRPRVVVPPPSGSPYNPGGPVVVPPPSSGPLVGRPGSGYSPGRGSSGPVVVPPPSSGPLVGRPGSGYTPPPSAPPSGGPVVVPPPSSGPLVGRPPGHTPPPSGGPVVVPPPSSGPLVGRPPGHTPPPSGRPHAPPSGGPVVVPPPSSGPLVGRPPYNPTDDAPDSRSRSDRSDRGRDRGSDRGSSPPPTVTPPGASGGPGVVRQPRGSRRRN